MRTPALAPLLLLCPIAAFAQDAGYQKALEQALKDYPPGDYDSVIIRRTPESVPFQSTRDYYKSPQKLEEAILGKTEDSRDSVESLFKAAADFVSRERYDLVLKRYRQILAREPDNEKAKAGLYDFVVLWTLYRTDAPASQIQSQYKRIEETVRRNAVTLP